MCIIRRWQSWVSGPSFSDPKAFALDPRSVAASVAASLVYFHAWITACNSHTQLSTLIGKQTLLQPAAAASCVYSHAAGMCLRVISSASAPHVEARMPLLRGGWHGCSVLGGSSHLVGIGEECKCHRMRSEPLFGLGHVAQKSMDCEVKVLE